MNFTYDGYRGLIKALTDSGYQIADYHNWEQFHKCVILRHDIDNSIEKALYLAKLENELGVKSTFFVLLSSDFYNPASKKSRECLRQLQEYGHEIGLHFDELAYNEDCDVTVCILNEVHVLSDILNTPITTVSMHRPSQKSLFADYVFPGVINTYSSVFFKDFKYLSDSRRHWREPVLDVIKSGQFDRLHILTHAIWYNEVEESIHDTIKRFVTCANKERYYQESDNIRDIQSILDVSEV